MVYDGRRSAFLFGMTRVALVSLASCRDGGSSSRAVVAPDPYADFAPLAAEIGDARVVALGEPSHAEGNMFETQARLVAFLHERLGFTVLAWEAGLWSCETDAARCVGHPWGAVVETRGVRPPPAGIHVSGFDFQFTGVARDESMNLLRDRLIQLLGSDSALAARLTTAFARFPKMQHFRLLSPEERSLDREAFRDVLATLETRRQAREFELYHRAVENVIGLYDWHEAVRADVSTTIDWSHNALNNVRDKAMADNVLWLMRLRFPGQKIILWLAAFHAARDLSILREPGGASDRWDRTDFKSMGSWLSDALGRDYFVLGMTAYQGKIGNAPQQREVAVGPPSQGSIDQLWQPTNSPFRLVPRSGLGDSPTEARFIGLHGLIGPWARVLDAGLVFRTVTPATAETQANVLSPAPPSSAGR
jgi:erythromycin esterase-like protein